LQSVISEICKTRPTLKCKYALWQFAGHKFKLRYKHFHLRTISPKFGRQNSAIILFLLGCSLVGLLKLHSPESNGLYKTVLFSLLAWQPKAVSASPDGRYLLVKNETTKGYNVEVISRESKSVIASFFSTHTQLSLTWRPNSKAVAFQEAILGNQRRLFIYELESHQKWIPNAPISYTALPPLKWDPTGKKLLYFQGTPSIGNLLIIDAIGHAEPIKLSASIPGNNNTDFAWSPDGQSIAVVDEIDPGVILLFDNKGHRLKQMAVLPRSLVRDLAWSQNDLVLAAVRGPSDDYFKLDEINLKTGEISLCAEAPGDIGHPLWLPNNSTFLYHVNSNGIISAVLGIRNSDKRTFIQPSCGVLRVTGVNQSDGSLFGFFESLERAPEICQMPAGTSNFTTIYGPPGGSAFNCTPPDFQTIRSTDGMQVHIYHWGPAINNGSSPTALIVVGGGQHLQTLPNWQPSIPLFLNNGSHVIVVNYRGCAGYGAGYERIGPFGAELDIVAAYNYAVETLKVRPERVFIMGSSVGAGLAANASKFCQNLGGLILISWPGSGELPAQNWIHTFPVFEFHGSQDNVCSPKLAQRSVREFFQAGSKDFKLQFHSFTDEGHFFFKVTSWAFIDWTILKLMRTQ